jgi:hypothetical protein
MVKNCLAVSGSLALRKVRISDNLGLICVEYIDSRNTFQLLSQCPTDLWKIGHAALDSVVSKHVNCGLTSYPDTILFKHKLLDVMPTNVSRHLQRVFYFRDVAQAVSRLLFTEMVRVRARVRLCGICGEQSVTGACFLRVLRFPLQIIPPIAPHS